MNNNSEKKGGGRKLKSVKVNGRPGDKSTIEKINGVISGDGLRLKLETNDRQLEIIGDGCQLTVINNYGKIKMIGDGSRLKIIGENSGIIEYHGDGGRIILPDTSNSIMNSVHYNGDGGKVNIQKTHNRVVINSKEISDVIEDNGDTRVCRTTKLIMSTGVKHEIYAPE